MKPAELLDTARSILVSEDKVWQGRWSRAAALLGRQALESAMDDLWSRTEPSVARCSTRAQLLCLPAYLNDRLAAEHASTAWWSLTRACHVHPYELSPAPGEVAALLDAVAELAELAAEA